MEDRVVFVSKKYCGTATLRFIFGWLGIRSKGPFEYYFSDGYKLRPYPISPMVTEWSHILRGAPDVTGFNNIKYLEALYARGEWKTVQPMLNSLDLIYNTFTAKEGDPALDRIREYKGPLLTDPDKWPEPYRTAYLESH